MLALSSMDAVLAAIRQAREVSCSAYRLRPGSLFDALGAAAAAGARVQVRLGGPLPGRDAPAGNGEAVKGLLALGADAALASPGGEALHLKAVIADGTLFLDDRNWPGQGRDTILATNDPNDLAAVRSALAGGPPSLGAGGSGLATLKGRALELEAETIAAGAPGDRVDCESESFGPGPVCAALRRRAESGTRVRLLVGARDLGAREVRALRGLAAAGAEVRLGDGGEKLALAGDRAWVGSANATSASPATLDWGYATSAAGLVGALRARFEEGWSAGRPIAAAAAGSRFDPAPPGDCGGSAREPIM